MAHFDPADTTIHMVLTSKLAMSITHNPTDILVKGESKRIEYKQKVGKYFSGLTPSTGFRNESPDELKARLMGELKHRVEWERYNT